MSLTGVDPRRVLAEPIPGIIHLPGNFYDCSAVLGSSAAASAVAITANGDFAQPFRAFSRNGYDRISINVTTGAAGGKLGRMAVYTMGADGLPGALLVDSGTFPADAITDETITVVVPTIFGDWYWTVLNSDGTPTVFRYNNSVMNTLLGYATAVETAKVGGLSAARAFAAFPASLAGVSWTRHNAPLAVRLRAV